MVKELLCGITDCDTKKGDGRNLRPPFYLKEGEMSNLVSVSEIKGMIIELRGRRVILDSDLAILYQAPTKRLMEQVKRNIKRFPPDFLFQLTREEWLFLKSQIATSGRIHVSKKKIPFVFTRNGANMVSAVLKSPIAVARSIQIMRAFTVLEEIMGKNNKMMFESPVVLNKLSTHSRAIMHLFQRDKINTKEVAKVKEIVSEMIEVLQRMVLK
ncbi:hypothetical protein A2625_06055 [candidate division WOR-1 bacterium RIFCSPHIGHO2_01_FULL_53_15]|uniref:KilA-N DNA-binding domain-containing protein n=1 Tax=candidate division WOR-1 bacterium RIFCSPHIGHO2_01_FULL_53_15 TaxID=1802564 RepID=A0A1F4Q139_UNCSA|nr:MAG: hypothetical protein A2625_06055 [candidate division WOR-1 bacterium RIFCSPHIGHO2_01_FULL_53_15]OGC13846.1 MAG: hypothetical protein A3D23_02165 [candidate division WOR-1 bacterium RIFCSPHIGHO2_02_FULL_53_26]